ncbi:replication protein A1-like protein, partial [Trifolium medium]|nr:replication protein A1-like protein [Trifolium medium]
MNYGIFASKIFSKDAKYVKLIDERGLKWSCTIQNNPHPYNHVKIGEKWGSMVRVRNYREETHIMFGSPKFGNAWELFVKK